MGAALRVVELSVCEYGQRYLLLDIQWQLCAASDAAQVDELWTPIIVPNRDMESFIRVSGNKEERVLYLDPAKLNFKKGDRVRVIGGSLTGVEGTFMQIGGKHEKRVVIQIEKLIAVATAAIPAALVEKIG